MVSDYRIWYDNQNFVCNDLNSNLECLFMQSNGKHAQISTTLNFYVHPLLSHNRIVENALQNLLLPPTNQV